MFCLTCDRLGVPRPVSVQNDFNFNNRTFETSCAEACHHLGVVGMPYGALGGGALTGKYQAVWKSTSVSGAPDNSSLSHFSAMTRPSWLGRAARNRHRHAIEQASRRWRGGRRDDSARTRRKILISTQAAARRQARRRPVGEGLPLVHGQPTLKIRAAALEPDAVRARHGQGVDLRPRPVGRAHRLRVLHGHVHDQRGR